MISIVLLLKIIGAVCFIGSWVYMFRAVRKTEHRVARLQTHYDERLAALAQSVFLTDDTGEGALAVTRRHALEAERRFTEGIASILNYAVTPTAVLAPSGVLPTGVLTPVDEPAVSDRVAGKKGE